ncbi:MAG: sugar phosphate isomerase/epimerase family protein [Bryobacteraceae bacterium]
MRRALVCDDERMKFGVNTFLWTASFGPAHFHLLPSIRERGFDGVEVSLFRPSEFEARAIRQAMDANQLSCTVCSVLSKGLSLVSDDDSVRKRTIAHLTDCVKASAEAGAELIAGPLYSPVGYLPGRRRTADEWERVVDAYQQLGPALDSYNVQICIEPLNRFETYFLNTTADAIQLCREIGHPKVGILWDTFHANIEEKQPTDALLATGRFLKHVHTSENDRGTPGTGHVEWRGVFAALRDLQYEGWLTIESFGFALGDLSSAASIWRDLAKRPEDIAWDGIEFLKRMRVES